MSNILSHLARAWAKHSALQMASLSVLTAVLVLLNFVYLSRRVVEVATGRWSHDLSLVVYIKDNADTATVETLGRELREAKIFDEVEYVSKLSATKQFLDTMGPSAAELLHDPKWESPLPRSFALKLSGTIAPAERIATLQNWSTRLHQLSAVSDVVYGQGWVENLAQFIRGLKSIFILLWLTVLGVGFLIVSNCIQLSVLQRREEIEILELVGATRAFIRRPFIVEGLLLGLVASVVSLGLSYVLQAWVIEFAVHNFSFVMHDLKLTALDTSSVLFNVLSGTAFGALGAWNCVRKLNTQWAAAHHA